MVSKVEEAKLGDHDDWCKGTPEGLQWLRMPAVFVPFLINDETFQVCTYVSVNFEKSKMTYRSLSYEL